MGTKLEAQLDYATKWAEMIAGEVNPALAQEFMQWVRALCSEIEAVTRAAHIKAEDWAKMQLVSSMAGNIFAHGDYDPEQSVKKAMAIMRMTEEAFRGEDS